MVGGVEDLEVERGGFGKGGLKVETAFGISANKGILHVIEAGGVQLDGLPEAAKCVSPYVGEEACKRFPERV